MQKREEYAIGVTNEFAEAKMTVGSPCVDGEAVVESGYTAASIVGALPDTMLVTLEVNGTVIAYREMFTIDPEEGYITVGDYTLANNEDGTVGIETLEADDVVRLMVEPVEVKTTDAFRAAVKKDAPETPNELPAVEAADKGKYLHANESTGALEWAEGGSGGGGTSGSLTVTISEGVFDKTWQEVKDAVDDGLVVQVIEEETIGTMTGVVVSYVAHVLTNSETYIVSIISSSLEDGFAYNTYVCSAADGYPEMQY